MLRRGGCAEGAGVCVWRRDECGCREGVGVGVEKGWVWRRGGCGEGVGVGVEKGWVWCGEGVGVGVHKQVWLEELVS